MCITSKANNSETKNIGLKIFPSLCTVHKEGNVSYHINLQLEFCGKKFGGLYMEEMSIEKF